jgi:uncharacterized membrane protein
MKALRIFLNYAIFSSSILLIFLLVFESYLFIPNIVKWIGHWHPVILHFPIVMILVVIIQFWRKDQYFEYYLGFTTFITFLTSITGLLLSFESGEKGDLISTHQWLGISVAFILGIWYWFSAYVQQKRTFAIGANSVLVILIITTGHFGGMITHGEQFLSLNSEKEIELVKLPDDPNIYAQFIQPILDRKCVACHNQNKSKGKLLLTNYEQLMRGGESGQLIDPENIDQSLILRRINLPLEAEEHMPPKEEPQLTKEEMLLLADWIQAGSGKDLNFTDLDISMESYSIIQKTMNEQRTTQWEGLSAISDDEINDISSNYISIFRLYQKSNALQVIMYPHKEFKPGDVKKLKSIADNIVELSLNGLSLSEEDMGMVGQMTNLEKLDLGRTNVEDGALVKLQSLQKLNELKIYDSNLNENSANDLKMLASLEKVFAYNSGWPDEELSQLANNNPGVAIITEVEQANDFKSVLPSPMIKEKVHFFKEPFKLSLEHPLKGIDIFYTLDGKLPDQNDMKYSDGIDILNDTKIIYFASKEGWQSSPIDSFKIFKAGSAPDDFSLEFAPNEKYQGTGPSMLFDLKKGPLTHNDSSWMAYRNNSFILECKWNSPRKIHEITLSTFVNTFSYIFPPEYIEVVGGVDPANMELLFRLDPVKQTEDRGASFDYHKCAIDAPLISYLKIKVQPFLQIPVWHQGKGERGWFFIDEVLIN